MHFFSFYEKLPAEVLDERDLESFFYHNTLDVSQFQLRKVRVSKGSNKKSFAIKLSQLCDLMTQQRYILQEEMETSKRELSSVVDSLRDFFIPSELLTKRASLYKLHYRNPKLRLDLQSEMTVSLFITITILSNIQIDKFDYRSDSKRTILASFLSKSLNYMAIIYFPQKLSTLTIAKITISTGTEIRLETSVK